MNDTTYVPPSDNATVDNMTTNEHSDLQRIAKLHRVVIACLWIYIALLGSAVFWDWAPIRQAWISGWIGIVAVVIGVVGAVPVYMLAKQLRAGWQCIPLGVLTPVPLVGFFTLLSVSTVANQRLRQSGVKVGLFGADIAMLNTDG